MTSMYKLKITSRKPSVRVPQVTHGGCLGVNSSVQDCAATEVLEPPAVEGLEAWPLLEVATTTSTTATAATTSTSSAPAAPLRMELGLLALCALLLALAVGLRRPQRRAAVSEEIEIPEVDRF